MIKVTDKSRVELVAVIVELKLENERLYGENERLRHRITTLEGMLGDMNIAVPEDE